MLGCTQQRGPSNCRISRCSHCFHCWGFLGLVEPWAVEPPLVQQAGHDVAEGPMGLVPWQQEGPPVLWRHHLRKEDHAA